MLSTIAFSSRRVRLGFVAGAAGFSLILSACGGGGGLADDAEAHADDECACTTFECTMEHTAWFNKINITQEEDLAKLSAEDLARFEAAETRATDCQNELR